MRDRHWERLWVMDWVDRIWPIAARGILGVVLGFGLG